MTAKPESHPTPAFPSLVEEKVGEGGMGVVFRAFEPALNRLVAIKRLRPELVPATDPEAADEARRRFLREARAAATLSHPGIATIYRVGEDESGPFIAMEWLDGTTLDALLKRGRLPLAQAVRLEVALLETLDAAHQAGIVHRDIKPANLIVLRDGRLKVTDFGIARVEGADLFQTQAGVVMASPFFASPEQMLGGKVDGRSDLFSAAVVLYLALTGRRPFEGRDHVELVTALLKTEPRPPSQLNRALPAGLDAVVLRALHKRPDERYARAGEMAAALRPFAERVDAGSAREGEAPAASARSLPAVVPGFVHGLPHDPRALVVQVARAWPARALGRQPVQATLDRLLEQPLHAEPFAGVVQLGRLVVLLHDGDVIGAFDPVSPRSGDEALEALPPQADTTLYAVPSPLPGALVRLLATLLNPPRVRHEGLDSSFVSLPGLARKLAEERFEGIVRLGRGSATALVLPCKGETVSTLLGEGWGDVPVDEPWQAWASAVPVQASVEEPRVPRLVFGLRRRLRDLEVRVDPEARASVATVSMAAASRLRQAEDPALRFLSWAVEELPRFFAERGKSDRWKFVVDWLPLVRRTLLHHELPRPDVPGTDSFDLVTFDENGKVLHLAQRVARAGPRELKEFAERVTRAKAARIRSGRRGRRVSRLAHVRPGDPRGLSRAQRPLGERPLEHRGGAHALRGVRADGTPPRLPRPAGTRAPRRLRAHSAGLSGATGCARASARG